MIAIKNINAIDIITGQVSNDFGRSNGIRPINHEFISLFNSKTDKKQSFDQPINENLDGSTKVELDPEKSNSTPTSSENNHTSKYQLMDSPNFDVEGFEEDTKTGHTDGFRSKDAKNHEIGNGIHLHPLASMESTTGVKINAQRSSESDNVDVLRQMTQKSSELILGGERKPEFHSTDKGSEHIEVKKSITKHFDNDVLSPKAKVNQSNYPEQIINSHSLKEVATSSNYKSISNSNLNNLSETIKSEIREFHSSGASNGSITIKIKPSILGEIIITLNRDDNGPTIRNGSNIDVRLVSSNPEIANYLSLIKREVLNKYGVRGVSILSHTTSIKSVSKLSSTSLVDKEGELEKH
ncbi:hypothetical protein QTV49_000323 [Vibrio vulnificus]|nr:hypothetical protein [Vibrio vulnificus]